MKKFTWTLAMCALTVVSCSEESELGGVKSNPNQINFRSNTSRAPVADLDMLKASTVGFPVYATSGNSPTEWFVGVSGNNYKYSNGAWMWNTGSPTWPTTTAGYPMTFLAYFPAPTEGLEFISPVPAALQGTYTIQAEADQVDLITAKSTALSKPASGILPLTFNHILSKINFGLIPGNGASVYLQSITVNNVGNKRVYDFVVGNWTATQPELFTSRYFYKTTANPADIITGADATESIVQSVTPTHSDLMLMPQTTATWTHAPNAAPTNAYMGVIYRLQTATDDNAVGYTVANNHPNYNALTDEEKMHLNGKPLFVSVGYPFAPNTMTWAKGKGYTYNICLGTANASNGYITDNHYYDENGDPTSLIIVGKNDGDPISNGNINFLVDIGSWDDSQAPSVIK